MSIRSHLGFSLATPRGLFRRPAARPSVRSTRRSARAAVLVGGAAAFLAQLGLAVAVEARRPEWRDPEFFHRRKNLAAMAKWADDTGQRRPRVVVLGTSRSSMGFSPGHLGLGNGPTDPLVANCSQTGCWPINQRLNLGRLLDAKLAPEFVLVEIIPGLLADPRPVADQARVARLGTSDLARLHPYLRRPAGTYATWAGTRAGAWHTFRFDVLAHAGHGDLIPPAARQDFLWSTLPADGWVPFDPPDWPAESRARGTALAHEQYADWLANFRVNPETARVHHDMLAECRAHGTRAAFFLMPESPTFRGWYPPGVRQRVREYLEGLSREFGVPVFDASDWIDDEAAFMDGHHLLRPAAVRVSERLGRDHVGPWVRGYGGPRE